MASLVKQTIKAGFIGGITTDAIDIATGLADLVVVMVNTGLSVDQGYGTNIAVMDNLGNSFTALPESSSAFLKQQFFYCLAPRLSTSYRVTVTGGRYCLVSVAAFTGVSGSGGLIGNASTSASGGVAIRPGRLVPTQPGELFITGIALAGSAEIDSGFAIINQQVGVANTFFGGTLAYKTQADASEVNPTWVIGPGQYSVSSILGFATLGGGGTSGGVEEINVVEFGADPTGVKDSTAAFNAVFNAIRAAGNTFETPNSLKKSVRVIIPTPPPTGFYRLTNTLDFNNLYGVEFVCPSRASFDKNNNNRTLFKWFGGEYKNVFQLHYTTFCTFQNISIDGRRTAGVVGIAVGLDGSTTDESMHQVTFKECDVFRCDIGMRIGDVGAPGNDLAGFGLDNCYFAQNYTNGLAIDSANADVMAVNLICWGNGFGITGGRTYLSPTLGSYRASGVPSPLGDYFIRPGCNVYIDAGFLRVFGYESAADATVGSLFPKPATCDLKLDVGAFQLYGCWSECPGPFMIAGGQEGNTRPNVLSGVSHYNGNFTNGSSTDPNSWDTPTSIIWEGNQVYLNGVLYGDVEVNIAQAGNLIDLGCEFKGEGRGFTGNKWIRAMPLVNNGNPEGLVASKLGDLYRSVSPGTGGELFVRASLGAGNTGWRRVLTEPA